MDWPRRWLARLGKLGIVLVVLAVVLTTGFFASLPEIVRQVVVRQVPKTIGRQISIEDVDLNLFTGYIAVKKLRLTERDGRAAFVEFERLEARLALWGIVGRNIRVRDFRLVGPVVRIVRGENGELNFQDLMPGVEKADVAREPTKWARPLRTGRSRISPSRRPACRRGPTPLLGASGGPYAWARRPSTSAGTNSSRLP